MRLIPQSLILGLSLLTFAACSSSPDAERAELRTALSDSKTLATEIQSWRRNLGTNVSSAVLETIQGFQKRAKDSLSRIEGLSDNATTGMDLAGVKQALASVKDFENGRFADAATGARNQLLDQFQGLATHLESAVDRVQARMG